jgi:PBSX family phage terminase large subunit
MKKYNPNLTHLINAYKKKHSGSLLAGSSRSGKTWSSIHFIIYLCVNADTPITITVVKETYNSFKTTLYTDFRKILNHFGLDNPFERAKEIQSFKILGSTIQFMGADMPSKFHGLASDFVYFNEVLEIPKDIFNQATQRCQQFWWGDYNPYASIHYIFDMTDNDSTVSKLSTTWKDNPYISASERAKIMSYETTPENVKRGTADEYMWKVYGLGERTAPEGLIFKHVNYIDRWPDDIAHIYGLDFGFTNDPSALVKVGTNEDNIYAELLLYEPTEHPSILNDYMDKIGIEKELPIIADSSDKYTGENKGTIEMVRELQLQGWNIDKVHKTHSIMFWLMKMKEKKINVIMNDNILDAKKEFENYRYKTINGITINQPIDKYNHFIDSLRYAFLTLHTQNVGLTFLAGGAQ